MCTRMQHYMRHNRYEVNRIQETHTGNNGMEERGRVTTTWTVHGGVPLVCTSQGGKSKRRPVDVNRLDHNNMDVRNILFVWRPQTEECGWRAPWHGMRIDAYRPDGTN